MSIAHPLTLDDNDPRVLRARDAERALFRHFGLEARDHTVPMPKHGIRLRVSEIGAGPPLLVVPGNNGDGFPFAPLLARLQHRRVLLLNRAGGGLSEGIDHRTVDLRMFAREMIETVLDAFDLAEVPILAHSIGGHMSQWFTMDRPERVTRLALLGVPGNVLDTKPPLFLRLTSVPGLGEAMLDLALKGIRAAGARSSRGATNPARPPELVACNLAFQELPHAKIATLSLMETVNRVRGSRPEVRITEPQLASITRPVMYGWGTKDLFGSVETGRRIASLVPRGEFHPIEGAGHLPWLDEPATCARLVETFLEAR